jgi:energy-coupling factor transporter ATP-binding protein EcfA2
MLELTVEFKNYKILKDLKSTFRAGHLYIIKGGNGQGKTSLIKGIIGNITALNKCEDPLTTGAEEGFVLTEIKDFKGANGQNYKIKFDFDDKKEQFTLVKPNAEISKKVTDIREILGYNEYTVDLFLSWGNTAEGRRKQAKIIFDLLPTKVKEEIQLIDIKINEKNGLLFKERAEAKKQVDAYQILIKRHRVIDNDLIAKEEAIKAQIEKLKAEQKKEELVSKDREELADIIDSLVPEKIIMKINNAEISKTVSTIIEKAKQDIQDIRSSMMITLVEGKTFAERLEKGNELLLSCTNEKTIDIQQRKELIEVQTWSDKYLLLDKQITDLRKKVSSLLSSSTLGIPGITIVDNEFYLNVDGKDLPFSEESLSYSMAGKIIARLILETNKNLPIVCVGKAAEYDLESLDELNKMAKEYGGILLCDYVVPTKEDIEIVAYEQIGND